MGNVRIQLQEFIDSYKASLGLEASEKLMREVLKRSNIPWQRDYDKGEAIQICKELKVYPGFIGIIGGMLYSRIILR
jgi:hypothetical protein